MADLGYLMHGDPDRFEVKSGQATMKAVVTTGNGGFEKLDYRDVPRPEPAAGELLLRVLAAGVNNTEINTRLGWYSSSVSSGTDDFANAEGGDDEIADGGWNETTPFPLIQGTDCCGEVVAAGAGVDAARVGQRVLVRACMRVHGFDSLANLWMASDFDGAFAQYVRVPASQVFAVDCDWSDAELATLPCAYGTAENMVHRCAVAAGDRVLVPGASGGVGSAVAQLCLRRGAEVVGVAGRSKLDRVRSLGIDAVAREIDLLAEFGERSFDVVIDNVAGDAFATLPKLSRSGGAVVAAGRHRDELRAASFGRNAEYVQSATYCL